jgi:hypothetical protein
VIEVKENVTYSYDYELVKEYSKKEDLSLKLLKNSIM